ncbi:TPA: restriction endonuclease subunit S [Streptococcus suis]|nr:restriction endonuclease subunit S [Streptococcus suis]
MTKIEEMIAELCPNGVEWKELGEICKIETGKLNANADVENGIYPFFTTAREISWINSFRWDAEALLIAGNANVGDVKYYSGKFEAYQRTYVLTNFTNSINVRYLFHYVKYQLKAHLERNTKKAAMSYIVLSTLKSFSIPIPPLKIQEEIVQILDKFTEYVTELTAELTAELTDRQKQYSFYRDKLLSFEDEVYQVEWKTLGELFEFKNGLNKGKGFFGRGTPIVNYTDVYKNIRLTSAVVKGTVEVSPEEQKRYNVRRGDVFFTRTSETKEEIGKTSVLLEDIDGGVFSGFVLRARPKTDSLLPEYCAHCFNSSSFRKEIVRYSTYTTRALTNGSTLAKLTIPLPPLPIQERIVQVLDNFDAVCNDLNIGLPKEIELRQKQYEYFREKLLTFTAEGVYHWTVSGDRPT